MLKLTRMLLLLAVVLAAVLPAAAQSNSTAFVRVGHFVADAPAVDVYVGDTLVAESLAYGDVTFWAEVPAGTTTAAVVAAGEAPESALLTVPELILEPNSFTTLSALGLVADDTFTVQPVIEDYATDIEPGETRVSLFHAMPEMTGIDLLRNGVELLNTVAFPNVADGTDGHASVESAAGTFDIAVAAAGRNDAVLASLPATVLQEDTFVAVFLYGTIADPAYTLEVVTRADIVTLETGGVLGEEAPSMETVEVREPEIAYTSGDEAHVRVAHVAGDAPAIDIYFNGQLSEIQILEYETITDWISIPADTYDVTVVRAGLALEDAIYTAPGVEFTTNSYITLTAAGLIAEDSFILQPFVENYFTPIQPGEARVTLFHAIPDMTGVDLTRLGAALLSSVVFPSGAEGVDGASSVEVAAGVNNYAVAAGGRADAVLVDLPGLEIPAGSQVSIWVYGTLADPQSQVVVVQP